MVRIPTRAPGSDLVGLKDHHKESIVLGRSLENYDCYGAILHASAPSSTGSLEPRHVGQRRVGGANNNGAYRFDVLGIGYRRTL